LESAYDLIEILTELNQIVSAVKKKASEGELGALTERLHRRLRSYFGMHSDLIQIPIRKLKENNNQVFSFYVFLLWYAVLEISFDHEH
jgi:hypothetical protein